jgi:hypothetical protein
MMLFTALALVASALTAQGGERWVGLQGGYDLQNNNDRNAKDRPILGLAAGT